VLVKAKTWHALRDLGEYRLGDPPHVGPERIFHLCHPDLSDSFPPLATLERQPTNPRSQPNAFVGRGRERTEVVALLQRDDVRLLTLTARSQDGFLKPVPGTAGSQGCPPT
jgi:hypothetical protein